MSTDTPIADRLDTNGGAYATDEVRKLERENARLREELALVKGKLQAQDKWLSDGVYFTTEEYKKDVADHKKELSLANGTIESRDRNIATLQEELAEAKANGYKMFMQCGEAVQRAEQAETRALAAEKYAKRPFLTRFTIDAVGDWEMWVDYDSRSVPMINARRIK